MGMATAAATQVCRFQLLAAGRLEITIHYYVVDLQLLYRSLFNLHISSLQSHSRSSQFEYPIRVK